MVFFNTFYGIIIFVLRKHLRKHARIARYVIYKETLIDFKDHFWTFVGSFAGIGLIGFLNQKNFTHTDNLFLIGSFGASSVLIYGIVNSPLAQPRNLVGGHVICALVGVTVHYIIPNEIWLSSAFAVSISIVMMQINKDIASSWRRHGAYRQYRFRKSDKSWLFVCIKSGFIGCDYIASRCFGR